MGKEDNTEEMIRQIQETRRQLAASLYNDFFGGAGAAGTPSSPAFEAASSGGEGNCAAKAPVQGAEGRRGVRAPAPEPRLGRDVLCKRNQDRKTLAVGVEIRFRGADDQVGGVFRDDIFPRNR